jgi:hypothetical protein
MHVIRKELFICLLSDSTVSEDARIEPRTVATMAVTAKRSNQSARSHLLFEATYVYCLAQIFFSVPYKFKDILIFFYLFSVATAYSNFGNRVKKVHQKLGEKIPELAQKAAMVQVS